MVGRGQLFGSRGAWLADVLTRLVLRYREVPIVFAGSQKFAEEWAVRFLGAASGDSSRPTLISG